MILWHVHCWAKKKSLSRLSQFSPAFRCKTSELMPGRCFSTLARWLSLCNKQITKWPSFLRVVVINISRRILDVLDTITQICQLREKALIFTGMVLLSGAWRVARYLKQSWRDEKTVWYRLRDSVFYHSERVKLWWSSSRDLQYKVTHFRKENETQIGFTLDSHVEDFVLTDSSVGLKHVM